MDRYDRIIRDVQVKTEEEALQWKLVNVEVYAGQVFNTHRVLRAFTAEYFIGKMSYTLLFVERKVDHHDDLYDSSEGSGFELLILDKDHQIVLSLYDGVVDRDDLLRLAGLIDEHNDRVKDFFAAFDESGAA